LTEDSLDDEALREARNELNHGSPQPVQRAFIYACKVEDIPANGSRGKLVHFENDEVALFLLQGNIYAISNICPHQSSPVLSEGYINKEEMTVECPLHGWTYRINSGEALIGVQRIPTYEVKVVDGEVWVEEPTKREGPSVVWDDSLY